MYRREITGKPVRQDCCLAHISWGCCKYSTQDKKKIRNNRIFFCQIISVNILKRSEDIIEPPAPTSW
jgi:hypothetical protein